MANIVATESFKRVFGQPAPDTFFNRLVFVARITLGNQPGAGGVFAWQNPETHVIFVNLIQLYITVPQAGQTLDVGRATLSTNSSDNFIDGVSLSTGAEKDSVRHKGPNGLGNLVINRAGIGASWITATASGTPTDLRGFAWIHYSLAEGL